MSILIDYFWPVLNEILLTGPHNW